MSDIKKIKIGDTTYDIKDATAARSNHTHNYAGSNSAGGPANSVKNALTFGSKTYNGSSAQTITLADLGGQAAGNYAILDSNGRLADSVIPAVAITDTYVVATETAMLALSAQKGDIAIRSDLNKSFVLQTKPASTLANWKELLTPTDAVLSVNGKTGAVTLNLDNINDGSTRKLADYVKKSLTSAKGDMIYASGANTPARLGIGSNGQFLSVANGIPKWVNNPNTDTHYTNYLQIKGDGTEAVKFMQNADKSLNLKPGNNVSISAASGEITISATDTTYSTVSKSSSGLCPQLPNETTTTKYLRQDGTWVTPPDNNTWTANSASNDGYVTKGSGQANKV